MTPRRKIACLAIDRHVRGTMATTHAILGAGGAIGSELVRELMAQGKRVRLVGRRAQAADGMEAQVADLTDPDQTLAALQGAAVAYLVAGLPYRTAVWEEQWPRVMDNTIAACRRTGARLVFFDNVYMYGRVAGTMTEATPYQPCSRKGEVRARIATRLLEAVRRGELQALIARSADFYGPECRTSVVNLLVVDRLAQGAPALWMMDDSVPHSLTWTPDAARGVALLADRPEAWGQVWHLPTAAPALTGREIVAAAAAALGAPARHRGVGRGLLRLLGLFNADLRASLEMLYQNEFPYVFDATKFNQAFGYTPVGYAEGLRLAAARRRALSGPA